MISMLILGCKDEAQTWRQLAYLCQKTEITPLNQCFFYPNAMVRTCSVALNFNANIAL